MLWAPDFEPKVSLSEAEQSRILGNLTQFQLPFGLNGNKPVKLNIPSKDELKTIEKAGKTWLRSLLKKNQSSDAHADQESDRQIKESEQLLKDALGNLLGK